MLFRSYSPGDHATLAGYLGRQATLPWLVSYDDTPLVRQLYSDHQLVPLPIRYSLNIKRSAQELLIAPNRLYLPAAGRSVRGAQYVQPS